MGLASVLLVLSPFTQINTPYPSTAYLKGYLEAKGVRAGQADLGIETILTLFSTQGLGELFAEIERRKGKYPAKVRGMLANKQRYIDTITAVVAFLQGKNDPLAYRICNQDYLPESDHGSQNEEASELYHQVAVTADEVYGYVEAMEKALPLRASGLHEDFRLLADFGGAVLAGQERGNGLGYQFVTWVWAYERQGVCHGHYYEDDFQSAKQDFAVRSGLISKAQLFSPEELTELYRATNFLLEEGPEPEEKPLKAIQEARTKIEYTVPDLQTRLEQTQSQEPQMNL